MNKSFKIVFCLSILIASSIISLSYYLDFRDLRRAHLYGIKEKAIVLKKFDEHTIIKENRRITGRGGRPFPVSKYYKFYMTVKYPLDKKTAVPDTDLSNLIVKNPDDIHILNNLQRRNWNMIKESEIIDVIHVFENGRENLFFAPEVEFPAFQVKFFYLFILFGIILSIIFYKCL